MRQKTPDQDWHPADVVAAVHKRHTSLTRLSRQHGYADTALRIALRRPWLKAEQIIAACIGLSPQQIWPSRYYADGTRKRGLHARGVVTVQRSHTTRKAA